MTYFGEKAIMTNIAAIASLVVLSSCPSNAADISNASVSHAKPPVMLTLNSVPAKVNDETVQSAVDVLMEAKKALSKHDRRKHIKPGIPDRVVEKEKKSSDKVLILGGAEAFPM